MSQFVPGKSAVASGHVLGSGDPLVISDGISLRPNCQILIPALLSSIAMTAPPALLKSEPKVVDPASTPQPALSAVLFTQLVVSDLPVSLRLTFMVQPEEVCSVIWLEVLPTTFTASMTSISPLVGQFEGSVSQSAGQVPQPIGLCFTSKMKRLLRPYCCLEVTRTEKRPVEALGWESGPTEVSTRRTAEESLA